MKLYDVVELEIVIQTTNLENCCVNVDKDNGDEGESEEFALPGVGVHHDHDACESEHDDHKDQTDNQSGLRLESVTKEGVEDKEGHVGNHGGHGQVTTKGFLEIVWSFGCTSLCAIICDYFYVFAFNCSEFVIPVSHNLENK